MSILLDPPSQLFFERPLTVSASEKLILTNTEPGPVAFKVKTTSPKQYCVRPNSGRIEVGEKIEIQILLQPFREEPPSDFKCKDKFLVQSCLIPPDKCDLPIGQIWTALDNENKSSTVERKLRCVFLPPSDGADSDTKPIEPTTPSPGIVPPPAFAMEAKKSPAENTNNVIQDPVSEPDQLASVKDALQQAQMIKSQLEKELEIHHTKIRFAETKASTPSRLGEPSDLQVQLMGGIAIVAFLLGAWLF